ncbi:autotransporter-associated N-terminal domain-containing protein [Fusobacterium pseudoperiodonticum]|uniref:Autotransporter domain-containing protein n=3 Tax=Fusobacterium TaxID=848 RepID=A0AAD0F214_9FUSO|nr:autotransporter-associated N-terminal domain-containing protein [Fusobacterium pseudoperiodonticum]ATV34881.1 autotransporter domain-containing protein [Fusobacterium pseudoperiodonticum]ATV62225.1 autotransporter domain-containing protein [Fusobacterium pseudoperiodonticum]
MGNNNLYTIEKNLRSIAKKYRGIKYSLGLAILFLMMGLSAFSEEVMSTQEIAASKENLRSSVETLQNKVEAARKENSKEINGLRLELIQLMEQGNQVVKSPWASWQFGANYMYNDWKGTYKGRGDKKEKYPYEGVLERDSNEFNRYVAPNSSMYSSLETSTNARSASTNSRKGLNNYGLASNRMQQEPIVSLEVNAGITPRVINKKSPDTSPAAPDVTLPTFEPKLITPPKSPDAPDALTINPPTFNLVAGADGNGGRTLADMSGNSNGAIESVVLTKGNFNITRKADSTMDYSYKDYAGIAPWGTPLTDSGNTFGTGGNRWTGWNRTGASTGSYLGFQKLVGNSSGTGAMLSNSSNLLTNTKTTVLREFVHMDHHGDTTPATVITGFNTGLAETTWDSKVSTGSNSTSIIGAVEDLRDNVNSITSHGNSATPASNMFIWMQSGRIVMEGSYNVVTNNYDHNGGTTVKSIAANVGDIVIQPHKDAAGTVSGSKSAIFSLSPGGKHPGHLSIMYNGSTGNMDLWTKESAVFLNSETTGKPISVVNRGTINMYAEKSAGIYNSKSSKMDLQFVEKGFTFNTATNTATKDYKPINIFGDSSMGIYWDQGATGSSIEGNFAVNIGAAGVGNKNFTTKATSTVTGGAETNGVALSNYDVNSSDVATTDKDYIRGSFGILSNGPTNLTSHQIKIFDKTQGNVGVHPNANVLLNIGGGSIELDGGTTAKNNIGVYINTQGSVKSTGKIELKDGVGNLAIFAVGGTRPTGETNNVEVREVKATDTKNSVLIYGSAGAKVLLSDGTGLPTKATYGLNISGATVEADASTVNKKDSGAVFATDTGTVITINRLTKETTPNISITGTKLRDADRYAGFGLMAKDGGVINAEKNYVKVSDGSTAVASVGTNANVNMTKGTVEYKGNGYALYAANGGNIDMTDAKLILDGNAIGYEKVYGTTLPITTTNMSIHIKSKDVTVLSLKNATAPLNVSSLSTTLNGWAGIAATPTYDTGAENYKMAAIDGLSAYNIDQDINRKDVAAGTADANSNMFVRNLLVQRAKVNLAASKNVTAYLNTADLTSLDSTTVVGLDMSSSANAAGRSETQINLASGSSVNADRVDAGSGAVGLFINYGEANIASGAKVNVEKSGLNDANAKAVGVYAVNGSTVNNEGEINVGGEGSIGVLGISYRKDSNGVLKRNEFGTKPNAGNVGVVNKGKIELDGKKAVGIYIENNDSNTSAPHTIEATNDTNGTINMSGQEAIGMAAKLGNLVNKGAINITADKGTGMFVETDGVRPATMTNDSTGTISIGDSTSESVLRTGMFTKNQNVKIINKGKIDAGKNSYAIYGKDVQLTSGSELNIGDNGVGIFSTSTTPATPNIDIQAGAKINLGKDEAVGVFLGTDAATGVQATGVRINDAGSIMNIGDNSYGYVLKGTGTTFTNSSSGSVTLGTKSVYLYSDDTTGNITNNVALTSNGSTAGTALTSATGGQNYGIYSAGTVVNNANIDFSKGIGNVGIYSIKGGTATNNSTITVGDSNAQGNLYSLGMAAGYARTDSGNIINNGTINVVGKDAIGMYASGPGSTATNNAGHTINLSGDGSMGMYLDNGAIGVNNGTITTVGNPKEAVGIVVRNGAEFTNNGTININSNGGFAFFKANGGIIRNYGTFHISGGAVKEYTPGSKPTGKELVVNGVKVLDINAPAGAATATITANGQVQTPVVTNVSGNRNMLSSNIGLYIDTLRGTNPITGSLGVLGDAADLIIGSEAAQVTTSKYIQVPQQIIAPYNTTIAANPTIKNWNIYSGALTWISTATLDKTTGLINNVYLAKVPYTAFAGNEATPVAVTDTYNFLDGLEQRYGVEELGTRENRVFQKLNSIGKNEEALFYQATDEMMGHQYANVQQRIQATGDILNKEFDYLRSEWQTVSKDSNKVKVFGTRGEYNTDTAGVIDYRSHAYGVAYVHEDETVKLGDTLGWYAGIVHNKFKFKDIGGSREEMLQGKVGLFKSVPFDDNNSLNWTISGDISVGYNKMHRRFLVVDEVFGAKGRYRTYGIGIKNEISKDFRLSESFSLKPYAALGLEYGRFSKIKERSGEIRLDVKSKDYFSIRPEIGAELGFKQYFGRKTLRVGVSVAYENELGRVANGKNKARVSHTSADWFNIRGEKEDRRGNVKTDLNIGVDNQRIGLTGNVGYDTKGKNIRGGLGLRVIF